MCTSGGLLFSRIAAVGSSQPIGLPMSSRAACLALWNEQIGEYVGSQRIRFRSRRLSVVSSGLCREFDVPARFVAGTEWYRGVRLACG